ncbi:MAG: hypothetical protein ACR2KC_03025 [Acidimicrobiales bacterium]
MDEERSGSGSARERDEIDSGWASWIAQERLSNARESRSKERWLRQQAGEEATLTGLLIDLAERRVDAVLTTKAGRHSGRLVGVGRDFCVVSAAHGTTLVSTAAVLTVTSADLAGTVAAGDRPARLPQRMADALADLAAERAPVRLRMSDGQHLTGALVAAGVDLVSLRVEGATRTIVHVALAAIESCASL